MPDLGQIIVTVITVVFGGAGFWAWLNTSRTATSAEYQAFVEDLQQERKDRATELQQLRTEIERERQARLEQSLLLIELVAHVLKLEKIVNENGGTVPPRPERVQKFIDQNHL